MRLKQSLFTELFSLSLNSRHCADNFFETTLNMAMCSEIGAVWWTTPAKKKVACLTKTLVAIYQCLNSFG